MNGKNKSRGGFTLVEMMVAALAFGIMMLVVGSMLYYAWLAWKRNNEVVAMQRNATIAMMMLSKEIRNSTYSAITPGAGISFSDSGASFTESGNRIVLNDGTIVVDDGLVTGSFITRKLEEEDAAGTTNQWVEVNFTLETTIETVPYTINVSPRN